jgi:hypothetical protein
MTPHIKKDLQFSVKIEKIEGLLWELPADHVKFSDENQIRVTLISIMNFGRLTESRVDKPSNLEINPDEVEQQEKVTWEEDYDDEESNAVCEYTLEYRSVHSGEERAVVHRHALSGLDTMCFLSSSDLMPDSRYFMRLLAIDFANNREQTEYIEFTKKLVNLKVLIAVFFDLFFIWFQLFLFPQRLARTHQKF